MSKALWRRSGAIGVTRREAALWALFFAMIFAAGWYRGVDPRWETLSGLFPSSKPLVILTADAKALPADFLKHLAREIRRPIEVETIEEFADFEARLIPLDAPPLAWLPSSWAKALAQQKLLGDLGTLKNTLDATVSPDFLDEGGLGARFVPLLWKVDGRELRVEGLVLPHSGRDRGLALELIREWLKTPRALEQVRGVPDMSSALKSLDREDLPMEKRASSLRDLDLRSLKTR